MSISRKLAEKLTAEQKATVNTGEQHQGIERTGSHVAQSLGRRFHWEIERQGHLAIRRVVGKSTVRLGERAEAAGRTGGLQEYCGGSAGVLDGHGGLFLARLEWLSAPFHCLFWTVSWFTFGVPKTGLWLRSLEK